MIDIDSLAQARGFEGWSKRCPMNPNPPSCRISKNTVHPHRRIRLVNRRNQGSERQRSNPLGQLSDVGGGVAVKCVEQFGATGLSSHRHPERSDPRESRRRNLDQLASSKRIEIAVDTRVERTVSAGLEVEVWAADKLGYLLVKQEEELLDLHWSEARAVCRGKNGEYIVATIHEVTGGWRKGRPSIKCISRRWAAKRRWRGSSEKNWSATELFRTFPRFHVGNGRSGVLPKEWPVTPAIDTAPPPELGSSLHVMSGFRRRFRLKSRAWLRTPQEIRIEPGQNSAGQCAISGSADRRILRQIREYLTFPARPLPRSAKDGIMRIENKTFRESVTKPGLADNGYGIDGVIVVV